MRGHPGIFVTSIKPGSSADRDGRLKIGDRLLEVDKNRDEKFTQQINTNGCCDKFVFEECNNETFQSRSCVLNKRQNKTRLYVNANLLSG